MKLGKNARMMGVREGIELEVNGEVEFGVKRSSGPLGKTGPKGLGARSSRVKGSSLGVKVDVGVGGAILRG